MYALPSLNSALMVPLGSRYFPSALFPHPTLTTAPASIATSSTLHRNELFMTLSLAAIRADSGTPFLQPGFTTHYEKGGGKPSCVRRQCRFASGQFDHYEEPRARRRNPAIFAACSAFRGCVSTLQASARPRRVCLRRSAAGSRPDLWQLPRSAR